MAEVGSGRIHRLWLPLLVLALATLGAMASLYGPAQAAYSSEHAEGLDDAYISYRYALNLVSGEGLVFNPGEKIEGYSNLLWVLVAALLLQVSPPSLLHFAVCGLNILLAVAGLWVFEGEMRRRYGEARALAAATLWAFYPFLWQWIGSGLEAIGVVLLQLLIWRSLSRAGENTFPWRSLLLYLSLIIFLRTDGFVLVFLVAGHFLLNARPAWALRSLLLGLPATLALFGFRLFYYRDFWPSTYYVKIAQTLPVRVLGGFERLAELLFVFVLAPFVLALFWQAWRSLHGFLESRQLRCPPELSLGLGLLAYWLFVGGDHFRIRFLLVLFPLGLAVIFGPFVQGMARDRKIAVFLVLATLYSGILWGQKDFNWRKDRYDGWIELGLFLGEHYPNALLAAEAVGKTPYFSGLRTIDMLGLCDAHISKLPPVRKASPGHEKSDGAYVLGRRPDVIVGHLRPDLSVAPDLTPEMYKAAGYHLAFLVNMSFESQADGEGNIIPAPEGKQALWIDLFQGYSYAVLVQDKAGPKTEAPR